MVRTSSSVSLQPTAPMLSSSWCTLVVPTITDVTSGDCKSHLTATWEIVFPGKSTQQDYEKCPVWNGVLPVWNYQDPSFNCKADIAQIFSSHRFKAILPWLSAIFCIASLKVQYFSSFSIFPHLGSYLLASSFLFPFPSSSLGRLSIPLLEFGCQHSPTRWNTMKLEHVCREMWILLWCFNLKLW